jgi:hypothetical protein
MTNAQIKDLFIEWALYEPHDQRSMIEEYLRFSQGNGSKDMFLNFLKDKLQIEGYWKKSGLA